MFRKPPSGLLAILVLSGFVIHWLADAIAATMVGDFVTRHLAIMFGVDATKMLATASEIMLPVIIAAILTYGAFLIGVKEKAANPSKLRIDFSEHISGCKSLTHFQDGAKATFYRLWVRPPIGQMRYSCTGTLVDIMAPSPRSDATFFSVWPAQRLPLTWATHTQPPVSSMELRDDHGQFLDVFFITESGTVGIATPGLVQPADLVAEKLWGRPCLLVFCVSVNEPTSRAQEVYIALQWSGDIRTSRATEIRPPRPTNRLTAHLQALMQLGRQART
ncbi:MAG: hypothetical protein WCA81_05305 [Rhizomicrobium sp.]